MPAAALTVTSADTAQTRKTSSNSEGRYSVRSCRPALTRSPSPLRGFGKLTRDGIRLEAAQAAEMNLALPAVQVAAAKPFALGAVHRLGCLALRTA